MNERPPPIRVLAIDDDDAIRLSLRILLRRRGYEVLVASNGADGFAQFAEQRPAIVLCDMIMPGDEGVETIRKIRDLSPGVGIIAMSGSIKGGSASFLERAEEAGANLCLEKPFDTEELLESLARLTA